MNKIIAGAISALFTMSAFCQTANQNELIDIDLELMNTQFLDESISIDNEGITVIDEEDVIEIDRLIQWPNLPRDHSQSNVDLEWQVQEQKNRYSPTFESCEEEWDFWAAFTPTGEQLELYNSYHKGLNNGGRTRDLTEQERIDIYRVHRKKAFDHTVIKGDYELDSSSFGTECLIANHLEISREGDLITNGLNLEIIANTLHIEGQFQIRSFRPESSTTKPAKPPQAPHGRSYADSDMAPKGVKGLRGGNGVHGKKGVDGAQGKSAGSIRIQVNVKASGELIIVNDGERGKNGGDGGDGGDGGVGQQGGRSVTKKKSVFGKEFCICDKGPKKGGDGGNAGNGGNPGKGGVGGKPGSIRVIVGGYYPDFKVLSRNFHGKNGAHGLPGVAGSPGEGGLGGRGSCGCQGRETERKGKRGLVGTAGLPLTPRTDLSSELGDSNLIDQPWYGGLIHDSSGAPHLESFCKDISQEELEMIVGPSEEMFHNRQIQKFWETILPSIRDSEPDRFGYLPINNSSGEKSLFIYNILPLMGATEESFKIIPRLVKGYVNNLSNYIPNCPLETMGATEMLSCCSKVIDGLPRPTAECLSNTIRKSIEEPNNLLVKIGIAQNTPIVIAREIARKSAPLSERQLQEGAFEGNTTFVLWGETVAVDGSSKFLPNGIVTEASSEFFLAIASLLNAIDSAYGESSGVYCVDGSSRNDLNVDFQALYNSKNAATLFLGNPGLLGINPASYAKSYEISFFGKTYGINMTKKEYSKNVFLENANLCNLYDHMYMNLPYDDMSCFGVNTFFSKDDIKNFHSSTSSPQVFSISTSIWYIQESLKNISKNVISTSK